MFKELSYQKKCLILLVFIPVFLLLAYNKSFSKAINAKRKVTQLKEKLQLVNHAQQEYIGLKNDLVNLDAIIGKEAASPDIVQQEIFDVFSQIPFNPTLVKLEETHKFSDTYFDVYTNSLLLKGDFSNLLQTAYYYEKQFEYSRLVSMSFDVKFNLKRKKRELFTKLVFQNYVKR